MEAKNNITTLHHLLDYEISRFISAEVELKSSLGKWTNQAESLQLKSVLLKYHDFIDQHITGIENFIDKEQIGIMAISNPVMLALINDTDECLSFCSNSETKDACLLACVQVINHYKIATYGTASAHAGLLELAVDAGIFHEAEINEKHIDDRLSQLAKYEINMKAKSPISLPG
ncbi:DUF892 family protein [Pedobacter gandavensis]|uniref:YciE/YciF ferroxidase family protein n=1 Tax=Pedobacter TaxID=84567 RepID=UPI001C99DC82|nr:MULTISPECIES: DUF892 family protein [Pedobacter]WGQ09837.1 DUF892 family protein [Pedobacter gandavensis]